MAMSDAPGAGELRERVKFQQREDLSGNSPSGDGYGNAQAGWQDKFTVQARIRPMKGGEAVLGQRLTGIQPVIITVRWSNNTKQVTPDWQLVDARTGTKYAVRSVANMDERKKFLDILAEAGVAA